jgi:PTS system mannose-specific IIA component
MPVHPRRRRPDNLRQLLRFDMTGLLVIAHAPLASALRAVAEHVYPECAASLAVLDVPADAPIDQIEAQAAALLARIGTREALILTDVFGATPCNVAQRLADGVHIKVVTGVSVPMLWRSLCYAGESLDSLVGRALAGATQGAMQVSPQRPQEQLRNPPDPNATSDSHDHQ